VYVRTRDEEDNVIRERTGEYGKGRWDEEEGGQKAKRDPVTLSNTQITTNL